MIESILILLKIAIAISLLNLVIGMIKPVYVLWFLDRSNRLKVLKIFGWTSMVLLLIHFLLKYYFA